MRPPAPRWAVPVALAALLVLPAATLGAAGPEPGAPGPLRIHTALLEEEAQVYVRAFTNRTGIEVTLVRQSTGVILNLLRHGGEPTPDVILGGPADMYVLAAQEGYLEPYRSPRAREIPAHWKDPDGYWTGVYVGTLAFGYNPRRVAELGLQPPESWNDLLAPEWAGEVVLGNPISSGTGLTILATLAQRLPGGLGALRDALRSLDRNVRDYSRSGGMAGKLVGLGQAAVGILFAQDVQAFRQQGYDIELAFPREGTGYEVGAVAIVRGSENVEAARAFVDFMTGPVGQSLYAAMGEFRLPTHPMAHVPPKAIRPEEVGGDGFDLLWTAAHREELLSLWRGVVERQRVSGEGAPR